MWVLELEEYSNVLEQDTTTCIVLQAETAEEAEREAQPLMRDAMSAKLYKADNPKKLYTPAEVSNICTGLVALKKMNRALLHLRYNCQPDTPTPVFALLMDAGVKADVPPGLAVAWTNAQDGTTLNFYHNESLVLSATI